MTRKERAARRARLVEYLAKHGSIPAARKAAKHDGVAAPTSMWLGALGDMLKVRAKGTP